uniref:TIR domain-containing protein n=1 Tax=Lates calcarifer TaxID=8187 RepID=A0A4W6BLF8_LATCA
MYLGARLTYKHDYIKSLKKMTTFINSVFLSLYQSQSTVPLSPSICVPPTLRDSECYHVFISYSSTDYQWTHSIINQLESCGLQVCYHERDFIPGRTVLENMSECIQESQKVLLVLSPEFVRSRWCLLEHYLLIPTLKQSLEETVQVQHQMTFLYLPRAVSRD